MSNTNHYITNGIHIYSIDYLMNAELNENDLTNIFDTNSLKYSIIIGMFDFVGINKDSKDIIDIICKNNEWLSKYHCTKSQRHQFENMITQIYMNVYTYSEQRARVYAQWFLTQFGFSVFNPKYLKKYDKKN